MKQPEDNRTGELSGLGDPGQSNRQAAAHVVREHPGRGRRQGQRIGAYVGAVKIGAENQRLRAKTGKSQAEFAKTAGISERTLRTWERGDPVSGDTERLIRMVINAHNNQHRRPAAYRCRATGSTWSGRGLMPAWLRVGLSRGASLADYAAA